MHAHLADRLAEVTELCRRFGVKRLDVFGSAARADFDEVVSDLDFLVEFVPNAKRNAFDNYFGLREGLIELFGRPIDLVTADQIRNRYFFAEVEASRQRFHAA